MRGLAYKMGLTLLLAIVFGVGFQNCSEKLGPDTNFSSSKMENGTGYGGKILVVRLASGVCADGSDIQSRIVTIDDSRGVMDRDDCQDIRGVQVNLNGTDVRSTMQINNSPNFYNAVMVGGRVYDVQGYKGQTLRFCHGESATLFPGVVRRSDVLVRIEDGKQVLIFESAEFSNATNELYTGEGNAHYSLWDEVAFADVKTGYESYRSESLMNPGAPSQVTKQTLTIQNQSGHFEIDTGGIDVAGMTCAYGAK